MSPFKTGTENALNFIGSTLVLIGFRKQCILSYKFVELSESLLTVELGASSKIGPKQIWYILVWHKFINEILEERLKTFAVVA